MDLEARRAIVMECYRRHGHEVLEWLSRRAVPAKTRKTRDDAVEGARVWAAAVMELDAALRRARNAGAG